MLHVKTAEGFQLPSNIFYKNGGDFLQVKKVFSNQLLLERGVLCSCELGTSQLIKSLSAYKKTLTDLQAFISGDELIANQAEVAELSNEINALKIEAVLINQQLEIIDNKSMITEIKKNALAVEKMTRYVLNDDTDPQIAVKIVPGNGTVNPDIAYSPIPDNMFIYNGDYYYIGSQADQDAILLEITNTFGDGKVALQVFTANQIMEPLRQSLYQNAETAVASLNKIISQQTLLDVMIGSRKSIVNIDSSLETENTDVLLKEFYGVNTILDIDGTISGLIKNNTQLKLDNISPALRIDTKTPFFPFTVESLNTKAEEILGYVKNAVNVRITDTLYAGTPIQIYTSSDIHEFDFRKVIDSGAGVNVTNITDDLVVAWDITTTNVYNGSFNLSNSGTGLDISGPTSIRRVGQIDIGVNGVTTITTNAEIAWTVNTLLGSSNTGDSIDVGTNLYINGTQSSEYMLEDGTIILPRGTNTITGGFLVYSSSFEQYGPAYNTVFSDTYTHDYIISENDNNIFDLSNISLVSKGTGVYEDENGNLTTDDSSAESIISEAGVRTFALSDGTRVSAGVGFEQQTYDYTVENEVDGPYDVTTVDGNYTPNVLTQYNITLDDVAIRVYDSGNTLTLDGFYAKFVGEISPDSGYKSLIVPNTYTDLIIKNSYIDASELTGFIRLVSNYGSLIIQDTTIILSNDVYDNLLDDSIHRGTVTYNNVKILKLSELVETNYHTRIVSISANNVMEIPQNIELTADISEVIKQQESEFINLAENVKPTAEIEWVLTPEVSEIIDLPMPTAAVNHLHTMIINDRGVATIQLLESNTISGVPHDKIISNVSSNIIDLSENTITSVNHPELIALDTEYDYIESLQENIKVSLEIPFNISEKSNMVHDLQENVNIVNDPIPFTVYQENIKVNRLDKPNIGVEAPQLHMVVVKNVGSVTRLDPIEIIPTKIPTYISTQVDENVFDYSLDNSITESNNTHIVSQLQVGEITRISKPLIDTTSIDVYVAESKNINVIDFGEYVQEEQLEYNIIQTEENIVEFGQIIQSGSTVANTENSIYIVSNTETNIIEFGNSFIQESHIDEDSHKILSQEDTNPIDLFLGLSSNDADSVQKVVEITNNNLPSFGDIVDTNLGAIGSVFVMDNGEAITATGISVPVIIKDGITSENYKIYRDSNNMIQMETTLLTETPNNYMWDTVKNDMYKLVSNDGYLDVKTI